MSDPSKTHSGAFGGGESLDAHARFALKAAGLGLWQWDVAANSFTIDAQFAAILGRPDLTAPFGPELIEAMTHPDDRALVASELQKTLQSSDYAFSTEHRCVRPDGQIVWLKAQASVAARDLSGRPITVIGLVEDRTRAKTAELEVSHARARFELALQGSASGVWDWNIETGELYWSPRLREMAGVPADAPVDFASFEACVHPDDLDDTRAALERHLKHQAPYAMSIRFKRGAQSYFPARIRGYADRDAQGRPVRMAGSVVDISAETEAERAASKADLRASLALKAAGLGLFEQDLSSGEIRSNQQMLKLLGGRTALPSGLDAKAYGRFLHPDDRARIRAAYARLATGKARSASEEFRLVRSDGRVRWVQADVLVHQGITPDARLVGVVKDLTERKEAELKLAEAKQRFERAVEGSLLAIWDWDLVTGSVYWSKRMRDMVGLGEDEPITSIGDVIGLIHPDDLDALEAAQNHHFRTGEPFDAEFRLLHRDGTDLTVHSRGAASWNEAGEPVRFTGSLVDRTAERAMQAEARLAGARAQYALEAASLGLWEFEPATGHVLMDERLAELLGRPELAHAPISEEQSFTITAPQDRAAVQARFSQLSSGEADVIRSEHRVVHADGHLIWILAHVGVSERDSAGRPVRLIGITQDLSMQKSVENALLEAKERAEAANAAKSGFLATMSHEIRTPLNGMLGMGQLLSLTELDARQNLYVATLRTSGRALSQIIDDVLDISRIEAGRLTLSPARTDVVALVSQTIDPMRERARNKGLTLDIQISECARAPVRIDATRMGQVLGNMVGNALKFTDSGGVRVRVETCQPGWLRFEVQDDGPGVSLDVQADIFNRFTQADMSSARSHGGAGLGLSIARELTELAGGRIGVNSVPSQGATFWFEIPAPRVSAFAPQLKPRVAAVPEPGTRVLVVEDNAVNRLTTREWLTHAGYQTLEAADAAQALAILRSQRVDAVLLDLHMPEVGGDAVLRAIRAGEAGPADVPVLIVTADVTVQARRGAAALGADGFIAKPIDFDAVASALEDAMKKGQSAPWRASH